MAQLLADENIPRPVVEALRALGHDVRTAQEEGLAGQPDPAILAAATTAGRIVLTQDRDFLRLHKISQGHAGVVYCTVDADAAGLAVRIDRALPGDSLAGQLLRVYRPSSP